MEEKCDVIASRTVSSLQRDPRVLLTSSFGLYNRTDYMKK
ncbi:WSSV369 [White spot syndrome virus]|uniref:WSSV369 n=1 Tax=White spot syndrome virus TaxID=342409 RepID=A0A2I6SC57_9VIRU|nr:WSSV369 [White spot syndrome virus]